MPGSDFGKWLVKRGSRKASFEQLRHMTFRMAHTGIATTRFTLLDENIVLGENATRKELHLPDEPGEQSPGMCSVL